MKNAAFCDVRPWGSCKNRRFGGMYRLNHQNDMNSSLFPSVIPYPVLLLYGLFLRCKSLLCIAHRMCLTFRYHLPEDQCYSFSSRIAT
jgi:hypothetical protein